MQYQTAPLAIQAVTWNGECFSELPSWLPERVPLVSFAMNPSGKLHCEPPYAWYGGLHGTVRLQPGDVLAFDEDHGIKVWKEEDFREVFITSTEPS